MLRKVSKKQSKINTELKKVYKELQEERPQYCTGCGRSDVPLSHSHLVPRSYNKSLETNKNNITFHCLSMGERVGCHTIWESKHRHKLLDYMQNLEKILLLDESYYFLISDF
jgi:hypothetical protein